MTGGFGDLVVSLRADSSGFASDLKKSQRMLGGFVKNAVSGFGSIGLAAEGVKTVFGALIGPMQEAQEAALAERKLAQVFKSTANAAGLAKDEIMALAAERQKATSFDGDETVNAAAILGSFTNIKGDVFKSALVSAQDLSAFMGQDLQTSIMQIGKALNDPAKGVSALARSGIQFSEAQKQTIKDLQSTGQLAKAQSIVLKELQTQFGGQAEALVDPIKQAENAWGDFMEEIGTIANDKILPLMPKIIKGIDGVTSAATDAFGMVGQIVDKVNEFDEFLKQQAQRGGMGSDSGLGKIVRLARGEVSLKDITAVTGSLQAQTKEPVVGGMAAAIQAMKASQIKPITESVSPIDTSAADLAKQKQMESRGLFLAEKQMGAFIRQGLAGLESGFMSLGPAGTEAIADVGPANQVGSLERNSAEAFEVLRANVGGGGKDIQKNQLTELQKVNKGLDKIAKAMNNPKTNFNQKLEVLGID